MRRVLIQMAVMALMGVSVAEAAPLSGVRVWAAQQGDTNRLALVLGNAGITNAADRAAVMASWDEDTVVGVMVTNRAFLLMDMVLGRDKFSAASMDRIKAAVLREKVTPDTALDIAMRFPVAERGAFEAALKPVFAKRYAAQPEMGRLQMKYAFLQNVSIYSANVSLEDLRDCFWRLSHWY